MYVTLPAEAGEPSKRLVGFHKVDLLPGASEQVTVTVDVVGVEPPAVVLGARKRRARAGMEQGHMEYGIWQLHRPRRHLLRGHST